MSEVYLDYNACSPIRPGVRDAIAAALTENLGNPSSIHRAGHRAKMRLEEARSAVARLLCARPEEIVFTSSGTEANNLALYGAARGKRAGHLIVSRIEHSSILEPAADLEGQGFRVTRVPSDREGRVDPAAVLSAVEADTILVSLMSSSNELGTIQAVDEVACRLQGHGILLHTDAVQSAGKIPLDVTSLRVDLLSLSSHKMGGPPGIGCLWIREGTTLSPMLRGGGQEANRRAGTEPLALIVGFGVAAELAGSEMSTVSERVRHLREGLEQDLEARFGPLWFHGRGSPRLPNTVSVGFPGHRGEDLVMALDLEGVAVSTGSACAVGTVRPSHVLEAIGCSPEEARSTLRISLGRETTPNDLRHFLEVLASVLTRKPLLRRTRGREVGAAPRDRSAGLVKR